MFRTRGPRESIRASKTRWWLFVIIVMEASVALAVGLPFVLRDEPWEAWGWPVWIPDVLSLLVIPVVVYASFSLVRQQLRERADASRTTRLMDTVLTTSREWLWALGPDGRFTFSSPAGVELTGYEPSELLGRHFSLIIDPDDLADALQAMTPSQDAAAGWAGLRAVCRHKDGSRFVVDVSGRSLRDAAGRPCGFEGTSRPLEPGTADRLAAGEIKRRIEAMLAARSLLTAFQPVRFLESGSVIGAEALTRFPSFPGISPEAWFVESAAVGLDGELEILALETALAAAVRLPPTLSISVNLSPRVCLDARLPDILTDSGISFGRIVLEVTERHPVVDYGPLAAALAPLRRGGLRVAVDDAGAGFASMRHVLLLKPDVIKLDRDIIAGIDTDPGQRALGAAMVGFAKEIGAVLIAEGIETEAELTAVARLGMTAGQGYLLGRPSVRPEDWALWGEVPN
ncbi:sensor domain-containing phosphodiesterase [Arthrobacter sp. B2a2-09]|uniref:sensor domain-containing phosphodiesterase n=1 Tax=Arthrobacter sp. B2a2-09 TaxID=2952822 RepID=UPI0022CD220F|nr:EAL domain-containing protein [Arthrobacter sp. B2a2-09]MCZ9884592.1 EAL domain-containing protein [Arthrobacter sp. B2a2-09]